MDKCFLTGINQEPCPRTAIGATMTKKSNILGPRENTIFASRRGISQSTKNNVHVSSRVSLKVTALIPAKTAIGVTTIQRSNIPPNSIPCALETATAIAIPAIDATNPSFADFLGHSTRQATSALISNIRKDGGTT